MAYYYDVVKSTYNDDLTVRTDSVLVFGKYNNEEEACQKAREITLNNELGKGEFYEVEKRDIETGSLQLIIDP